MAKQKTQATVGVEVPEEAIEAAARSYFAAVRVVSANAWDDQPETVKVVYRQDARAILAAAVPHIEQAIRTEEREKVLNWLESKEAVSAVADRLTDLQARRIAITPPGQAIAATRALGDAFGDALHSLPIDAMEEPPEEELEQGEEFETEAERLSTRGEWPKVRIRRVAFGFALDAVNPAVKHPRSEIYVPESQPPDSLDKGGEAEEDQELRWREERNACREALRVISRKATDPKAWPPMTAWNRVQWAADIANETLDAQPFTQEQVEEQCAANFPHCTDQPAPKEDSEGDEGGFLTLEDVEVRAARFDSAWELEHLSVETPEESVDLFPEYVVIGLREELDQARREFKEFKNGVEQDGRGYYASLLKRAQEAERDRDSRLTKESALKLMAEQAYQRKELAAQYKAKGDIETAVMYERSANAIDSASLAAFGGEGSHA